MPGGRKKNNNKRATSSGNSPVKQQGGITKINLEGEQTISTGKDESIKSTATNDNNIFEQTNQTNVGSTKVDQASGFNELPFLSIVNPVIQKQLIMMTLRA